MIRLATMTYTLGAVPGLYELEQLPAVAARCGVKGLNWVGTAGRDPERLRRLTIDAGLEVSCMTICPMALYYGRQRQEAIDEIKRGLDDAAALGAPCVMIVPLPPGETDDREKSRCTWYDLLRELAPLAEAAQLTMTIENYEGAKSPFVTAEELLSALDEVPTLKFTFDAGNAAMGEDPVECARRLADHIAYVHLQDWEIFDSPGEGRIPGLDGRHYVKALVGEGALDTPAIVRELVRQNYDGFLDIEYVGSKYPPAEAVSRAVRYLDKLIDGMA